MECTLTHIFIVPKIFTGYATHMSQLFAGMLACSTDILKCHYQLLYIREAFDRMFIPITKKIICHVWIHEWVLGKWGCEWMKNVSLNERNMSPFFSFVEFVIFITWYLFVCKEISKYMGEIKETNKQTNSLTYPCSQRPTSEAGELGNI